MALQAPLPCPHTLTPSSLQQPQQHWQTLDQVLDDLQSRFIINIPDEELESVERICFQIEQAHWFYEDFVRECNPYLPSFSLKKFSALFFHHCPLLVDWAHDHEKAFATFMEYKVRVPVCGAIILNETMDKVLLVKGFKSTASWCFPRGKINKEERKQDCAIREVYEETGFDMTFYLKESDFIERTIREQQICMYIVKGVPEATRFRTQTRKEIGDIQWFPIEELPGGSRAINVPKNKFYMVTAFLSGLKKWITRQKSSQNRKAEREFLTKRKEMGSDVEAGFSDAGVKSDAEFRFLKGDVSKESVDAIQKASHSLKSLLGIQSHGSNYNDEQDSVPADQLKFLLGVKTHAQPPTQPIPQVSFQNAHKSNLLGILMKNDTSPLIPAQQLPQSNPSDANMLKSMLGVSSAQSTPEKPSFPPPNHKSDLLNILMCKDPTPSNIPPLKSELGSNSHQRPLHVATLPSSHYVLEGDGKQVTTAHDLKKLLGVINAPEHNPETINHHPPRRTSNKDHLTSSKTATDVPSIQGRKDRKPKPDSAKSIPFGKVTILKRTTQDTQDKAETISSPLLSFCFDVDKIMDCFN